MAKSRYFLRGNLSAEDRFILQVAHCPNTGCWFWEGVVDGGGYGMISLNGKRIKAHQYAWLREGREITPGMCIDHLCRVRCCVNPAHMELVTPKENTLRGISPSAINSKKICCKRGHQNWYYRNAKRRCYTCQILRGRNLLDEEVNP